MRFSHILTAMVVVVLLATPLAAFGTSGPSDGVASSPSAIWDMNESRGASTMTDSSANGRHGTIGDEVVTTGWTGTDRGYRWPWTSPTKPPARPERLVTVPDDQLLDPGADVYSISFRFKTKASIGKYLQKGQATTPGGQVKVQAPKGIVSCLFKGSAGRSTTSSKIPLDDGQWHAVTCRRDVKGVTMYVDGEFRNRNGRASGYIDNSFPFTIGGKPKCEQVEVTCDYFVGTIDWVRIGKG